MSIAVLEEVFYVLEGLYQVPREDIVDSFRERNNDVIVLNADVLII